ncbi:MAG: chemotaxis protein [Nitrosopumilaceae archaeon]
MPKKQKKKVQSKFSKNKIIGIGAIVAIVAITAHFGISSMIPVNSNVPIFAAPGNTYIKALHSSTTGYVFASQSLTSGKKSIGGSHINPTIRLTKGELESVHLINEDKDTGSKHNINIDEFNVHSRDLGYFETQTITFIVDKSGSFRYYCTIHPEMNGTITKE